jgi:DHA3 family macrolide efflux protein-like MFS transporter
MIVPNVIASLSTLVIALFFDMDTLMLWQLDVALSISSIANAFISPSLQSSAPLLIPKERLNRASGRSQLMRAVETILEPGLAGFVVGSFGLGAIFVIDFATFGASIVALLLTYIPRSMRTSESRARPTFWHDLAFGFRSFGNVRPLFSC